MNVKLIISNIVTIAYVVLVGLGSFEVSVHILNARIPYPIVAAILAVSGVQIIAVQFYKRVVRFLISEIRKM